MKLKSIALIAALLTAAPLWAHHGLAGFDQSKPVHLVGKVSTVDWSNPHVVIHLDVSGADGKTTTWLVNTFPPNVGKREGFSVGSFALGTELTIDAYQATDGSKHVDGAYIVFKDGKKIGSPGVPICFTQPEKCFHPEPPSPFESRNNAHQK